MFTCKTLLLAMLFVATPVIVFAQPELNYESSCLWSGGRDVVVDGQYAYMATASGLAIFDISNPLTPDSAAFLFEAGECLGIEKVGNYVFLLADKAGLIVVDVTDPTNPVNATVYRTPDKAELFAIDNTTALLDVRGHGIYVLDISNPLAPDSIGGLPGAFSSIALRDSLLYGAYFGSITIFDISDLANPQQIGLIGPSAVRILDVALSDTVLYALQSNHFIIAYSVTDPTTPDSVGQVEIATFGKSLTVQDTMLYVCAGRTVQAVKISNPALPVVLSNYNARDYVADVYVTNHILYAAGEGSTLLETVNYSYLISPEFLGAYTVPAPFISDAGLGNGYAYVACENGLRIVDVGNPLAPIDVGGMYLWGRAKEIRVKGNQLALSRLDTTYILDIQNPTAPALAGKVELVGGPWCSPFITTDTLFLSYNGRVHIYDVFSPSSPDSISVISLAAQGLEVHDSLVYIAEEDGLDIYNINDANNPVELGYFWTNDEAMCVTVRNNVAYVGTDGAGLYVCDVSDPANPDTLITLSHGYYNGVTDVQLQDSILYAVWGSDGLTAINISDSAHPKIVRANQLSNYYYGLEVRDSIVYVAGHYSLQLFKTPFFTDIQTDVPYEVGELPEEFIVSQNFPNPFNPSTTIEYTLPRKGAVTIEIYNSLGQHVRTLVDAVQPAGAHNVVWDGADDDGGRVSTGVYFYRITNGDLAQTRKMLLLK